MAENSERKPNVDENIDRKHNIAENADGNHNVAENADRKPNIDENADRKHDTAKNADSKQNIAESANRKQFFKLERENELRILVGENYNVKIELLSGHAEAYGTEIEPNKEYSLSRRSSMSIFSWPGCMIKVSGTPEAAYVVNEASMMLNVILHASLEERRLQAKAENKRGPVVLVVGQNDVSKSTLCRLLLNYAVRLGRHPVFVDLDVGQNSISLSGSIGVLTVKKPADIVTGFDDQPVKIYHFGYRSAWQSIVKYTLLLQRLSLTLRSNLITTNQNVKTSGVIINGCDWSVSEIRHHGIGTIYLAAENFEIDVVCVLHEENLFLDIKRKLPESVEVIFMPSIDVERRSWEDKSQSRLARMHEYFYGPTNQLQQSFTFGVKFSDIQVFKVIVKSVESYPEFSGEVKQNEAKLMPVQISRKLIDQILSLSSADNVEIDIMYMHVIGFICITDVDIERNIITVLSPQPGPLPKKILLMGDCRIRKCQSSKKTTGQEKVPKSENRQEKVMKLENHQEMVTKSESRQEKGMKLEHY